MEIASAIVRLIIAIILIDDTCSGLILFGDVSVDLEKMLFLMSLVCGQAL